MSRKDKQILVILFDAASTLLWNQGRKTVPMFSEHVSSTVYRTTSVWSSLLYLFCIQRLLWWRTLLSLDSLGHRSESASCYVPFSCWSSYEAGRHWWSGSSPPGRGRKAAGERPTRQPLSPWPGTSLRTWLTPRSLWPAGRPPDHRWRGTASASAEWRRDAEASGRSRRHRKPLGALWQPMCRYPTNCARWPGGGALTHSCWPPWSPAQWPQLSAPVPDRTSGDGLYPSEI